MKLVIDHLSVRLQRLKNERNFPPPYDGGSPEIIRIIDVANEQIDEEISQTETALKILNDSASEGN